MQKKDENLWLQYSGSGKGFRFYTDIKNKNNSRIRAVYASSLSIPDDYYQLDGKTYGLTYQFSNTIGNAMMSEAKSATTLKTQDLQIKPNPVTNEGLTLLAVDSEITMWQFENVGANRYLISAEVNGETKYLNLTASGLTLVDRENASELDITGGTGDNAGKIKISNGNRAISYHKDGYFTSANNNNDASLWLNLTDYFPLTDNDFVTYTAQKVSISDVQNGQNVIVYTRVWNGKGYDFYALDHNGNLVPCYERGDDIMWHGNQVNTLLWDFTEYYWENTIGTENPVPNYYYELQNQYSGKYLAPQLTGNQLLSDETIGINLPGRKNGYYYSEILAWDDDYYTYAGVVADENNGKAMSGARTFADTFYFAVIEPESDTLTKVETVDHTQYGITMKMIDWENHNQYDDNGSEITHDYFGGFKTFNTCATTGLLSTYLKGNGYPDVAFSNDNSQIGKDFGLAFANATEVNHLFLQSTYEESGYFEFDSCQNFASLIQENGSVGTDFIVYKELGTSERDSRSTLKHGQFLPYNNISAGNYSNKNKYNIYSAQALYGTGNEGIGILPDDDPRKYERLYTVGNKPNYYNGMELSASFVQTPNGQDAWGHDIIFEFTGDDDFWLYVDDELVIDLGGVHSALSGSVNFATGQVIVDGVTTDLRTIFENNYRLRNPGASDADVIAYLEKYFEGSTSVFKTYSKHTMKIFYMERGGGASNLHMRFNLSSVTPGTVMLEKKVTGSDDIDFSLVQFPFQIYYQVKGDTTWHLLANEGTGLNEKFKVTYQNSPQTVDYKPSYTPAGGNRYNSVYLLNPGKTAEIQFPSNLISYKIVECGTNTEVYNETYINGVLSAGTESGENRRDYATAELTVDKQNRVVYENHVSEDAIRTMTIQKKLYDAKGEELSATDDPTPFTFRLALSQNEGADPVNVNMAKYYVKNPEGVFCTWDVNSTSFVPLPSGKTDSANLTDAEKASVTFESSPNGSISKIPAGFKVEVPGIPVGTRFIVAEEDSTIKPGYKRVEYQRVEGSYYHEPSDASKEAGKVREGDSPYIIVKNQRGWEIKATKVWADADTISSHGDIFTAVYVKGNLLAGSVRQISSPDTTVKYYFDNLEEDTDFADYLIKEVTLDGSYTVNTDGMVTVSPECTVSPVENGHEIGITNSAGEDPTKHIAGYQTGDATGAALNVRTDTITNTPKDGIKLRLFQWGSDAPPLAGGVFQLRDSSNNVIGADQYISDQTGTITILCKPVKGMTYTLEQISAPSGWIGLQEPITFTYNTNGTVTINNPNGSGWTDDFKPDTSENPECLGYIDVHNKPFTLQAVKLDKSTRTELADVHFALYRSVENYQGNLVKDYTPMTGFADLVTDADGIIPQISNALASGTYYLTETQPLEGYEPLSGDVVFTISERGIVTLGNTNASLLTDESNGATAYTLQIWNTEDVYLTITKHVTGAFGSKIRQFEFTLDVANPEDNAAYTWHKNGEEQPEPLHPGATFTLSDQDTVTIALPPNSNVTITEDNSGYETTFQLNQETPVSDNSMAFTIGENAEINVTNTKNGILPTGIRQHPLHIMNMLFGLLAAAVVLLKHRKQQQQS